MATSKSRTRPGDTATPSVTRARATARPVATGKATLSKTTAKKKAAVSKAAATKATSRTAAAASKPAASRATRASAKTTSAPRRPATTRGKAAATAGPSRAVPRKARPKAAKVLDAFAQLRKLVLDALDDLKAKDVVEVDVRGKSSVADLLVVASGTSSRHVKSIADEVVIKAKRAGVPPIGVEGQREAEWVLVDLGDVIVHVMLPRTREFYGLERLWSVGDSHDELPIAG